MESISILIPIYNYDVQIFVNQIINSFSKTYFQFEIICIDDHSDQKYKIKNSFLKNIQLEKYTIRYIELKQNIGRTAIRNKLAKEAKFDWILFFDCDINLRSINYATEIQQKIHKTKADLYCGGVSYSKEPPADQKLYLHWKIGKNKEGKSAKIRSIDPFKSFNFNNLLIKKELYLSIKSDESIIKYGNEDTVFGLELSLLHPKIVHYDNFVDHLGLEPNNIYLSKMNQSIDSLLILSDQYSFLKKEIKLLKFYFKYRFIISLIPTFLIKIITIQLKSKFPSLILFDLYKLLLLHIKKAS